MAKPRKRRLRRRDWIAAARSALIRAGVENISIEQLARDMAVTRGSFYWHFSSRSELLNALLSDWEENNTEPLLERIRAAGPTPEAMVMELLNCWVDETVFNPAHDNAVRSWAQHAPRAAATVRRVDAKRIGFLHEVFRSFGSSEEEALIRARVAYFHQVGYYAMELHEPQRHRAKYTPHYYRVLTGRAPPAALLSPVSTTLGDVK